MENRDGYAYGIWLLLTPTVHVPFRINHMFHITLISGILCRRQAQNLFFRLLQEKLDFPRKINSSNFETMKFFGEPSCALGWKADIPQWDSLTSQIRTMFPGIGNVPDIPHISLQYFRNSEFTFSDHFYKNLTFSVDIVLVDMNDSHPCNWKTIH
jgi:hypothetical protein